MPHNFFNKDTRFVARALLGMELERTVGKRMIRAMITETEAYYGFKDKASHASRGKTLRNAPMFDEAGTLYVYLVYGMHYCLNIVTGPKDYPAAVLIRGIRLISTGERINGPGRVTRALHISKTLNDKNIRTSRELYFGRRIVAPRNIKRTPRVGVAYAGDWAHRPLRFLLE